MSNFPKQAHNAPAGSEKETNPGRAVIVKVTMHNKVLLLFSGVCEGTGWRHNLICQIRQAKPTKAPAVLTVTIGVYLDAICDLAQQSMPKDPSEWGV